MAYAYKVRPRWLRLRDHLRASFVGADPRVCIAFWLFGACQILRGAAVLNPSSLTSDFFSFPLNRLDQ